MKTALKLAACAAIMLATASCHHKDLIFEHAGSADVEVVFDWRNAPDANPESMALYMFDNSDGSSLRYIFPGRDGGIIRIPSGNYDGLGLNSDDNDWAVMRSSSDIETFETSTPDATSLSAYGLASRALPRAEGTDDERMASTPGMLWSNRQDNIDLPVSTSRKIITLYPEEAVCHYTVDIEDVQNIEYIHGGEIDGTLSGMSESFMHGRNEASDTHVTMPFTLTVDEATKSLHSEFLTFGESPDTRYPHKLTAYLFLSDGSKWYYIFDAGDQIYNAPDPHHVHIVLRGLTIPKPLTGGGFNPDVGDWQPEYIDLTM